MGNSNLESVSIRNRNSTLFSSWSGRRAYLRLKVGRRLYSNTKFLQSFGSQLQRLIFFAEAKSYLLAPALRHAIETGTWHAGHTDVTNQVSRELHVVSETKARDIGHDVVGPVRPKCTEPRLLEHWQKQI